MSNLVNLVRAMRYAIRSRPALFWAATVALALAAGLITASSIANAETRLAQCLAGSVGHAETETSAGAGLDSDDGAIGSTERAMSVATPEGMALSAGLAVELVSRSGPAAAGRVVRTDGQFTVVAMERSAAVALVEAGDTRSLVLLLAPD